MTRETVLTRGETKLAAWAIAIGMVLCALGMTAREGLLAPDIPERATFVAAAPEAQPLAEARL